MSRRNTSSYAVSAKPVCVHCRNLGFPFDHWLRSTVDPNSPVVCPILLNTECRYCHEFGHTVGRCPKILNESKSGDSNSKKVVVPVTYRPVAQPKHVVNRGGFSALDSDSEEEEGEIKERVKPIVFVSRGLPPRKPPVVAKTHTATNYTGLIVIDKPNFPALVALTEKEEREVIEAIEKRRILFTSGKSWADICYIDEE